MNKPIRHKTLMPVARATLYKDEYAMVSFVESIPCIKLKLDGVPHSSEHYQFVHTKLLEFISGESKNYFQLHLLTDSSKAGLVLDEDMSYYKMNVAPALEKAGIRYHAIVLPKSLIVRLMINQIGLSTKKLKVAYFNSLIGASKWLKNR
jgi:hypothetical protein